MAQLINEAKRMQFLAGLITESQLNEEKTLTPEEQELIDAVLKDTGANTTSVNEGKIDLNKILARVKLLANKGLLTAAMASTILASCGTAGSSNDMFKRELENAKKVQDLGQVQQAKIDSVTNSMTTGQYK
jgi:hypothetical protein